MKMFLLGALAVYVLNGIICLCINQLVDDDVLASDIKDIACGGWTVLPLVIIGNIIYRKKKKSS